MASPIIKIIEIRLILENEVRAKKGLPLIQNIEELKSLGSTSLYWEEIQGTFKLSLAKIDTEKLQVNDDNGSLVLKLFANRETMEIRQFASKFTDEPQTIILP